MEGQVNDVKYLLLCGGHKSVPKIMLEERGTLTLRRDLVGKRRKVCKSEPIKKKKSTEKIFDK